MADGQRKQPWRTDGKFFRVGATRVRIEAVTYGPFPGGWPASFDPDFQRIAAAGFNALRLYDMPPPEMLDAAWRCGLRVFSGLKWGYNGDFLQRPALYQAAEARLLRGLRQVAGHPGLAGVYVANEVPSDLVRWMGPLRVRQALERLIALGRVSAPGLLFAYANYPSTEYLEPANADFSAFNVYLEDPSEFRGYLKRLHHIAGDRPLVVSEFGLDSRRNGLARQAETLTWGRQIARDEETAGFTIYAWSDRWWNADSEVLDWDFGLTDRSGNDKTALLALSAAAPPPAAPPCGKFSVIICTRNGRGRIGQCLEAVGRMAAATADEFETWVVDDGSSDGTADFVARQFPWVQVLCLAPCGLSAARNQGAAAARGAILAFTDDDCQPDCEWLTRLARGFATGRFAAVGGPNLPPAPRSWREAVVSAAPGAPSHVMLDDEEAEHLPGCNLAVTRAAFDAIGGFDPAFHTAGDDVDFCWRLRAAGFRLGFAPGAFVWHWRRSSLRGFLRQQLGYGRAECLLIAKHPGEFSGRGGAKWQGFIYGGGPVRVMAGSIIYHGPMGTAGYQRVTNRMLPLRDLDTRFDSRPVRLVLLIVTWLVPRLRAWVRTRPPAADCVPDAPLERPAAQPQERLAAASRQFAISVAEGVTRDALLGRLLAQGWQAGGPTDSWDAAQAGSRVLLATEHGEDGSHQVLVRVWGDPAAAERLLLTP